MQAIKSTINESSLKLGILGAPNSQWKSLEKTMAFYRAALADGFQVVDVMEKNVEAMAEDLDCVLNFNSIKGWEFKKYPWLNIIHTMHGGLILDKDFLSSKFNKLEVSDLLIVNCTSDIAILEDIFTISPQICCLPLPVDTNTFKPLEKEYCRQELKLNGFDCVIGFVGRILPQKNLHTFLRMLKKIKTALYPKKICAVVNGKFWADYPVLPYVTEKYLENIVNLVRQLDLTNEVFYFDSNLSNMELSLLYNSMDILIHPTNSLDENFGYVPIEAMACGVPVIGAAYGGLKDSIISGRTGYLMPSWITEGGIRVDYASGIDAALKLLSNSSHYKQMSRNCLMKVKTDYSFETCKRRLIEAVSKSIESKKASANKSQLVKLKPRIKNNFDSQSKYLPHLNRPWEYFKETVSYYVSSSCPKITLSSKVTVAAPVIVNGISCTLDDDAWPAKYDLSQELVSFLRDGDDVKVVKDFTRLISLEDVQKLVDIGLLVVKNEFN